MYKPPFTISSKAINLIAKISSQIERYAIRMEQSDSFIQTYVSKETRGRDRSKPKTGRKNFGGSEGTVCHQKSRSK